MLYYDESKLEEAIREQLARYANYANGMSLEETRNLSKEENAERTLMYIIGNCRTREIPPPDKGGLSEIIKESEIYYQYVMGKSYQGYKFGDVGYVYTISSVGDVIYHNFYYAQTGSSLLQIDANCFLDCSNMIKETQELINKVKPHLREYIIGLRKIYERRRLEEKKKAAEFNARFPDLPRLEVP